MDLSKVQFTEKDIQDYMDSLDVDAILKNIDKMPSDSDYESSFSHDIEFNLGENTNKSKPVSMQDLGNKTRYRAVKNFETDLIA